MWLVCGSAEDAQEVQHSSSLLCHNVPMAIKAGVGNICSMFRPKVLLETEITTRFVSRGKHEVLAHLFVQHFFSPLNFL